MVKMKESTCKENTMRCNLLVKYITLNNSTIRSTIFLYEMIHHFLPVQSPQIPTK